MNGIWLADRKPGNPIDNMEIDTKLLGLVSSGIILSPVVRVYSWDRRAVTIGRHQNEDAVRHQYPNDIIVRRPTGGRAVLHGDDLTVSVVIHNNWFPEKTDSVITSYQTISRGIIDTYRHYGIQAADGLERTYKSTDRIDCFAAAARCDIVEIGKGRKITGGAQRREKDVVLQQMSLILLDAVVKDDFISLMQCTIGKHLGINKWDFIDTELFTVLQ